jgi:hypothetical protein
MKIKFKSQMIQFKINKRKYKAFKWSMNNYLININRWSIFFKIKLRYN